MKKYSIFFIVIVSIITLFSCKALQKWSGISGSELSTQPALILIDKKDYQITYNNVPDLYERLRHYYFTSTTDIILERAGETVIIPAYVLGRCIGTDSLGNPLIVFRDATDAFLTFTQRDPKNPNKYVLNTIKDVTPSSVWYGEYVYRVVFDKQYNAQNITTEPGVTTY